MPRKKTHEEFIKQVNERFNHNIEVLGEYRGDKIPIDFKCINHNYIWKGTPSALLVSKCGCSKCGIELRASKKRKTHEVFIEEMESINNNIEILSKYFKSNEYIKCRCKIDGYEWEAVASGLLSGNGCPKCGVEKVQAPRRRNQKKFVEQLYDVNPNVELISSYVSSHEKIFVKCKVCDYEWSTLPSNLLYKKSQCPQCVGIVITPESFKRKVYDLVGNEYSVITNYTNASTSITFRHNECGTEFKMKPRNFFKSKTKCSNPLCKHHAFISDTKRNFEKKIVNMGYVLASEYTGIDKETSFKCLKCNTVFTLDKASRIYNQTSTLTHCPSCSKKYTLLMAQREYNTKFNNIFGEEFEITTDYIGSDSPINILHKKCGNISSYSKAGRLLTDYLHPCKFCNISNGEKVISDYLDKVSISYEKQKKYDNLRGINNGILSYDFFLEQQNLLIEFQGKQHYHPTDYFGGQEYFEVQQEHDKRKRQYAKDNDIKLLEIAYWDFENIEKILSRELGLVA